MKGENQDDNLLMGPADVYNILGLKYSTFRKYVGLLQKAGYEFYENSQGRKGYFNKDVIVLKRFLELKENNDITVEEAAKQVVSWSKESGVSLTDTRKNEEGNPYDSDIKELKEIIYKQHQAFLKQSEMVQELMNKVDQQQRYINDRLEERDRKLEQHFSAIAATNEEENKKGLFQRLFGK